MLGCRSNAPEVPEGLRTTTSLGLQMREANRAIGPEAICVPPRRCFSTDCNIAGSLQPPADLAVGIVLLIAFLLISSIRMRTAAGGCRGRIPKEGAARKERNGKWQRRRNPPMAGGAVYDSRRCRRLRRSRQLKLSGLWIPSRPVCRLILTLPAAGPVRPPSRIVSNGCAGVLIGGSRRRCRQVRRCGPAKKGIVLLRLGGLSFLLDLVRRAEVPPIERFTLQARGIDWAEGHACSPSDMAAPRIAS